MKIRTKSAILASLLILLLSGSLQAQTQYWDAALAKEQNREARQTIYSHNAKLSWGEGIVTTVLKATMFLYQSKITYQMPGSCLYAPSCSEFSRQSFQQFGLAKGSLLSMDRLMRCNRMGLGTQSRYDLMTGTMTKRYSDPPERYRNPGKQPQSPTAPK